LNFFEALLEAILKSAAEITAASNKTNPSISALKSAFGLKT